ncbi:MAG: hypothetical protein R3D67_00145 [Hyphomicrobiaceae bacterium]
MQRLKWMLACAAVVVLSTSAPAFQETKGGVAEGQQGGAQIAPGAVESPNLELKDTGVSVAPSTGVEVRIPGLGKLGVLPKFDFGLELLYGLNEAKGRDTPDRLPTNGDDDVQIRGSFKHRF